MVARKLKPDKEEDKRQGSRRNERKNQEEEEEEEEKKKKSDEETTNGISPSVKLGVVVEPKCTKKSLWPMWLCDVWMYIFIFF